MTDLSRRAVLAGGGLTVFFASFCTCASHAGDDIRGCQISDAVYDRIAPSKSEIRKYIRGDEPVIARSGDANLDYALAQTLAKLAGTFEVLPGFGYYDDFSSRNAYATARTRLDRADGTVLFGLELLRNLRTLPVHPDAAIATVCAHEFGHILQFKRGLFRVVDADQPNVKRSELQADYFSGYFAGLRRLERPSFPSEVFISTMRRLGDDDFASKNHHGTPKRESKSRRAGVRCGLSREMFARGGYRSEHGICDKPLNASEPICAVRSSLKSTFNRRQSAESFAKHCLKIDWRATAGLAMERSAVAMTGSRRVRRPDLDRSGIDLLRDQLFLDESVRDPPDLSILAQLI